VHKPVTSLAGASAVPDMLASAADLGWGVFAVRFATVLKLGGGGRTRHLCDRSSGER